MIAVVRIGTAVQHRVLRIFPLRRFELITPRTVSVMQHIGTIADRRGPTPRIIAEGHGSMHHVILFQLTQGLPPICIITVLNAQVHYMGNRLVFKLRIGIIGQIFRPGRVRYRHSTPEKVVTHSNRRRFVRITHAGCTPRRVVGISRNHAARPGTGLQLAVRIVAVGRTGSVRIRLRYVEAAIVVGPARHLRRRSVLVGGQGRLLPPDRIVGPLLRIGVGPGDLLQFTAREIFLHHHAAARQGLH